MKWFYKPSNHELLYYVKYTYDNGYANEIHEFWSDTEGEYLKLLLGKERHVRYHVLEKRPPLQAGLTTFRRG